MHLVLSLLLVFGLSQSEIERKQVTLKVQLLSKRAWGGEGYHFRARVLSSGDQSFSQGEIQFDTHSGDKFLDLESVAGKETYIWEYGDPATVSNSYTTLDVFLFELQCEEAPELKKMPEEKMRYEREYFYETAKSTYWWIRSVRPLSD